MINYLQSPIYGRNVINGESPGLDNGLLAGRSSGSQKETGEYQPAISPLPSPTEQYKELHLDGELRLPAMAEGPPIRNREPHTEDQAAFKVSSHAILEMLYQMNSDWGVSLNDLVRGCCLREDLVALHLQRLCQLGDARCEGENVFRITQQGKEIVEVARYGYTQGT